MSAKAAKAPERLTIPEKHVHLHIELDSETEVFQYRAIINGEHTVLRPNDTITFRSKNPFSIRFNLDSPFTSQDTKSFNSHQDSGEWIVPVQVRADAPSKSYPYTVEMKKFSHTFCDGPPVQGDPEIIIER